MKKFYLTLIISAFCFASDLSAQSEIWGLTTAGGGGYGTMYGMPTGSTGISNQYNFVGYQGAGPQHTKLLLASNGKMYGTTLTGGANNVGVLFEYNPSTNAYVKLVDFSATNGSSPRGAVIQASNGKLYGT